MLSLLLLLLLLHHLIIFFVDCWLVLLAAYPICLHVADVE